MFFGQIMLIGVGRRSIFPKRMRFTVESKGPFHRLRNRTPPGVKELGAVLACGLFWVNIVSHATMEHEGGHHSTKRLVIEEASGDRRVDGRADCARLEALASAYNGQLESSKKMNRVRARNERDALLLRFQERCNQ